MAWESVWRVCGAWAGVECKKKKNDFASISTTL